MTRVDRTAIVILACVALVVTPLATAGASGGSAAAVAVVAGPTGTMRVPLDRCARYRVDGLRGCLVVEVARGRVAVVESTCPDKVCVHTGAVSDPGECIACVPNGVTVRIEGGNDVRALDALVR